VTHAGNLVTLSDFYGCSVRGDARFEVPWSAFAGAVLRVGESAVRRSGAVDAALDRGITELRRAWREELRARLRPLRARRRSLDRAASRGTAAR
jgi:hypothetical protein